MRSVSFCIVGEQGVGKSMIADYLKKKFPRHERITSSHLWDEIVGRPLAHHERAVVQRKIVAERGELYFVNFMMKWIASKRKEDMDKQFIIEGIRSREVFEALRKYFGRRMLFIGAVANKKIRLRRLYDRDKSWEKIKEREKIDSTQFDLRNMVKDCDVIVKNDFEDKEPLYRKLDSVLRETNENAEVP